MKSKTSVLLSVMVGATKGKALSALWTFPAMLLAAFLIAWGAEAAQVLVSQGLALAVLAWLQTSPEFAVEGVIAWRAGQNPTSDNIGLMTANFTGALRLLIGFGWPIIYFTAWLMHRRLVRRSSDRQQRNALVIEMSGEDSLPIVGLLLPTLYAFFIVLKGTLNIIDAIILIAVYLTYLRLLQKIPPRQEEEITEMEHIPRWILSRKKPLRNALIAIFFVIGGTMILTMAHPFVESMLGLAVVFGLHPYFAVQWIAPFLSEFPEFVSTTYWARKVVKAPMALLNTVSSSIAELTLLIALIPIVYSISHGYVASVPFDWPHRAEILLTCSQALLGFLMLANFRFHWYEALGVFLLWFGQFLLPSIREEIIVAYWLWILIEIGLLVLGKRRLVAFGAFRQCLLNHRLIKSRIATSFSEQSKSKGD